MNSEQKVKYLIENNIFMVVSTADASGKPWVSPVGFVYDNKYNLYWVSYKDARHSKNIRSRPEVAISIFGQIPNGGPDGVYIDGKAAELRDDKLIHLAIDLFATKRPQPERFAVHSVEEVSGDSPWRMYMVSPIEISKRSNTEVSGRAITNREVVDFWK
jgi:nitroimidazol reductase NimA-like FMN-containing flavoprotein (pyridoxamine 5'-phosphate oxidase superfamily)